MLRHVLHLLIKSGQANKKYGTVKSELQINSDSFWYKYSMKYLEYVYVECISVSLKFKFN